MNARSGASAPRRLPEGTRELLLRALREDRVRRDLTTHAIVPAGVTARARVVAEKACVVSGLAACAELGRLVGVAVRPLVRDGGAVRRGAVVLSIEGDARSILSVERTMVNLLMHLSGVATATRDALARLPGRGAPRVYATRKTLPGLRALEKTAVQHGGGWPHRADLASGILVKNNHLAFRSIPEAVRRLRRGAGRRRPIEVEVRGLRDVVAAVDAGAEAILIDNASPSRARALARAARERAAPRSVWVELSGGITATRLSAYRRVGADAVSLGSLTHSAPAVPFHLRIVPSSRGRGVSRVPRPR